MTRYWAPTRPSLEPDPVSRAMLVPGGDSRLDLGSALLAAHRSGAAACEAAAGQPLVDEVTLVRALGQVRAALAPPMIESVAKCVDGPTYGALLVRDVLDDAEECALEVFRSAVAKGVPPPMAAQRAGAVYGVPGRELGRYRQLAVDPKASPVALTDAADRALFAAVEKIVADESRETVSKAPTATETMTEAITPDDPDTPYWDARNHGQFAAAGSLTALRRRLHLPDAPTTTAIAVAEPQRPTPTAAPPQEEKEAAPTGPPARGQRQRRTQRTRRVRAAGADQQTTGPKVTPARAQAAKAKIKAASLRRAQNRKAQLTKLQRRVMDAAAADPDEAQSLLPVHIPHHMLRPPIPGVDLTEMPDDPLDMPTKDRVPPSEISTLPETVGFVFNEHDGLEMLRKMTFTDPNRGKPAYATRVGWVRAVHGQDATLIRGRTFEARVDEVAEAAGQMPMNLRTEEIAGEEFEELRTPAQINEFINRRKLEMARRPDGSIDEDLYKQIKRTPNLNGDGGITLVEMPTNRVVIYEFHFSGVKGWNAGTTKNPNWRMDRNAAYTAGMARPNQDEFIDHETGVIRRIIRFAPVDDAEATRWKQGRRFRKAATTTMSAPVTELTPDDPATPYWDARDHGRFAAALRSRLQLPPAAQEEATPQQAPAAVRAQRVRRTQRTRRMREPAREAARPAFQAAQAARAQARGARLAQMKNAKITMLPPQLRPKHNELLLEDISDGYQVLGPEQFEVLRAEERKGAQNPFQLPGVLRVRSGRGKSIVMNGLTIEGDKALQLIGQRYFNHVYGNPRMRENVVGRIRVSPEKQHPEQDGELYEAAKPYLAQMQAGYVKARKVMHAGHLAYELSATEHETPPVVLIESEPGLVDPREIDLEFAGVSYRNAVLHHGDETYIAKIKVVRYIAKDAIRRRSQG